MANDSFIQRGLNKTEEKKIISKEKEKKANILTVDTY